MEKRHYIGKGIFALLVAVATLASCSKDSDNNDTPTPPGTEEPRKEWPENLNIKQGETFYISFHSEKEVGEKIYLKFSGSCWVDLNNNGKQDADELTKVSYGGDRDRISYTLKSKVFTLYGNISSLDTSGCSLKDIDVSHSPALKSLVVDGNSVAKLDLKGLEKELTMLMVAFSQIKELDLTGFKKLSILYLNNNKLEKLNLTGCEKLSQLRVESNEFKELDLTGHKELSYLEASYNKLTQLKVNGCEALKHLSAYHNFYTELDLSDNKALNILIVSNNLLSELDLSQNTNLSSVAIFANKFSAESMLRTVETLPVKRVKEEYNMITLQTFRVKNGKQLAEDNKISREVLIAADRRNWIPVFLDQYSAKEKYNGDPNAPFKVSD